jgi:hypothetical protein
MTRDARDAGAVANRFGGTRWPWLRLALAALFAALTVEGCGDDGAPAKPNLPEAGAGGSSVDAGSGGNTGGKAGANGGANSGGSRTMPDGGGSKCKPGVAQCIGDRVLELCSPAGDFVAVTCGANEHCTAGDTPGCEVVKPCKAGEKRCATDAAAKVCDADETAWVVQLCASGDVCKDGECVLDVKGAECEPGSERCADATTALRCSADGHGFDTTDCPTGTSCRSGQCIGSVCVVGETSCVGFPNSALRTCVDGDHFTETPCSANAICQTTNINGVLQSACRVAPDCGSQGQRVCGDPTDPSVAATAAYSECTTHADGGVGWVRVDCTGSATCDPANVRCSSECVPGEKRCSGIGALQECTANATWGPAKSCNSGATSGLGCRAVGGGKLPSAECVDEACAGIAFSSTGEAGVPPPAGGVAAEGVCDGTKIRRCSRDGHLQPAEDCAGGACRIQSSAVIGGLHPGVCTKTCSAGETRCVADGQPLFVSCGADGSWSTAYQSCNSVCRTGVGATNLRVALCGDACVPGTTRCSGEQIQTCGSNGKWATAVACSLGRCTEVSGEALCHADCIPGETMCVGAAKTATDGVSKGTAAAVICSAKGVIPTTSTACPGAQTCRTSQAGIVTGCVECLGSGVRGGNENGLVDSRCTTDGKSVEVCGDTNDWKAATSCGTGACFVGRASTCGRCPGFDIGSTCTQAAIQDRFGATCNQFGFGTATVCGNTNDCCSGACETSTGAFAFCAPKGFSACLGSGTATELSAALPQTKTGSTLFSDDTLSASCGTGRSSPDDAYLFTAPRSGTFVFDTFGSTTDTVLYVIDALGCGELACNDDTQGSASRVFVSLVSGQRVIVMVEGTGDYALHLTATGTPGCGNGIVDGKDLCDGNDLNGQNCLSASFGSRPNGTLKCSPTCVFDLGGCSGAGEGGLGTGGFGSSEGGLLPGKGP